MLSTTRGVRRFASSEAAGLTIADLGIFLYTSSKKNCERNKIPLCGMAEISPAVDAKCRIAEICRNVTKGSVLALRAAFLLLSRLLLLY